MRREARRSRTVQPGEKVAQGNLTDVDRYLTGGNEAVTDGLFSQWHPVTGQKTMGTGQNTSYLNIRKKSFFYC